MTNNYFLYDNNNKLLQFVSCDESEISLYGLNYLRTDLDNFEFKKNFTYFLTNGIITEVERSDIIYIKQQWKMQRQTLVDNIEVAYNNIVYQGDETSQDRMSRAINGLPDDTTIINWKAKDNSTQALTRPELKEILFLAGQEQTKIWFK